VLLPFAWPLVRGQQERGHKRKTPTFTVLQAAGAWPLTETVRDADKGGNVEEGGVFPRSSPRGHLTGCCPAISPNLVNRCCSASTGSVTRGARSIRSSCAWADALASPASRSTRTPSGTREPGGAGARLRPRDAGQATEPRHADTRTPQQYDDVAPAAGPCRAPSLPQRIRVVPKCVSAQAWKPASASWRRSASGSWGLTERAKRAPQGQITARRTPPPSSALDAPRSTPHSRWARTKPRSSA
jgi:hypothetical protein